jgi:opacity protein-like surface antigen
MKTKTYVLLTLIISGTTVMAQETSTPQVEIGLNYSFDRINPGGGYSAYSANGGFGDVEYNLNRHLGIVADLGANYVGTVNGISVGDITFQYLFGPRFNIRHGRFNPYFQALFGEQRFSNGFNPGGVNPYTGSAQNNFAMAIGGGLNIAVSNRLSVRPFEVDYLPNEVSPGGLNYVQNNFRYAAGVVLRLGSK